MPPTKYHVMIFNEVFFIEQQVAATWDQNQMKDIDKILNPDKVASL